MKSFVAKILIAIAGLTLATAPLTASAAPWSVGVGVYGPGYSVRVGNGYRPGWRPAPVYHRWYPRPVAVAPYSYNPYYYSEGYYGVAPGGYYGYYHHGRWFTHRRWNGGVWFYF